MVRARAIDYRIEKAYTIICVQAANNNNHIRKARWIYVQKVYTYKEPSFKKLLWHQFKFIFMCHFQHLLTSVRVHTNTFKAINIKEDSNIFISILFFVRLNCKDFLSLYLFIYNCVTLYTHQDLREYIRVRILISPRIYRLKHYNNNNKCLQIIIFCLHSLFLWVVSLI